MTEEQTNELLRYQTVTLPGIRACWELYFAAGSNSSQTEVRELMRVPFGKFGAAVLASIGKSPAAEVAANLQRFKQVMETGKVVQTSYSIHGKFRGLPDK